MTNPLINPQGLPAFSRIRPEHIMPALSHVLAHNRAEIQRLLDSQSEYTWDNLVQPLIELNEAFSQVWSPVAHLQSVADSEALRAVYNECLPLISEYHSEIGQNSKLFKAYRQIADSAEYQTLDAVQRRIIDNELRDFRLSGIDLPPAQQQRYRDIQQRLSKLSAQFSENLLDATHAWRKHITDESLLSGLPDSIKSMAQQNADQAGIAGWVLTLDMPCYIPCLNYLDNRNLREEMYVAFVTRASEQGPNAGQFDNSELINEILALRHELAKLLDFDNYAEYSLHTKMAENPQQVIDFLHDLSQRSRPMAEKELAELRAFAAEEYGADSLQMWDVPYFSEKLRQHRYTISQETLRAYFPLPHVLKGLFNIVQRLYGITVRARDGVEVWHPSVQFFEIMDETNTLRGQFYLDPYARQGKRGGAWMGECLVRKAMNGNSTIQTPTAYLVCNFSPPASDQPSLLTHQDVLTLFHEFGHGLHHMLTRVDYPPVSGINGVAWDAVELPSQFMENWCWARESLNLITAHYQTDDPLPEDLFEKMQAAKNFQAGLFMLRQLEFSIFDFQLHRDYQTGIDIQAFIDDVRTKVAVLVPPAYNRFQHSFGHIFSGGYAAGYYSYKWAEVLSADAFSLFEENGIFDQTSGKAFLHHILEQGGSREPMELFVKFRGREPRIDALLRHTGLQQAA